MRMLICWLLLNVSTLVFSDELMCPYQCGTNNDPAVCSVGHILLQCLKKINFLKERMIGGGGGLFFEEYDRSLNAGGWNFFYEASYGQFFDEDDGDEAFDSVTEEYFFTRAVSDDEDSYDAFETNLLNYSQTNAFVHGILHDARLFYDCLQKKRLGDIEKYRLKVSKSLDQDTCSSFRLCLDNEMKALDKINCEYVSCINSVELASTSIDEIYRKIFDHCIHFHRSLGSFYYRGLLNFQDGYFLDAFSDIETYLKFTEKNDVSKHLSSEAHYYKGLLESEMGSYLTAVESLSRAIQQNPENREAYVERAVAYYEMGEFDLSLEDYLASGIKPCPINASEVNMLSFSLGLTKGILKGGTQAGIEFIPSLLSSLHGIGHGLWAFAQDPIQVSSQLVNSVQACLQFIKNSTPQDALSKLVPELRDLFDHWEQFQSQEKGEITGQIIGKYGVDIFAGVGVTKGMKLYRELKRANNLLTLEAMAVSNWNRDLIKLEAVRKFQTRQQVLQHANLKIQWDKQGKHIVGHRNFGAANRSIFEHSNPQKLANDFCGKGRRIGNKQPGTAGYQEIVNFEEFIGYSVNPETGEKIATNWGKIHYAQDGVHIVPTEPRW